MRGMMSLNVLVGMILIIIAGIALGTFIFNIKYSVEGKTDKEICKDSVLLIKTLRSKTKGVLGTRLECPARNEKISGEPRDEARAVVNHLRECWDKMLKKKGKDVWEETGVNPNVCIVCSTFNVERDVPIGEFYEVFEEKVPRETYLTNKQYLASDVSAKIPVRPYLISLKPERGVSEKRMLLLDELEKGKEYFVMYTYINTGLKQTVWVPEDAPHILHGKGDYNWKLYVPVHYANIAGKIPPDFHHVFVLPAEDTANLAPVCDLFYHKRI